MSDEASTEAADDGSSTVAKAPAPAEVHTALPEPEPLLVELQEVPVVRVEAQVGNGAAESDIAGILLGAVLAIIGGAASTWVSHCFERRREGARRSEDRRALLGAILGEVTIVRQRLDTHVLVAFGVVKDRVEPSYFDTRAPRLLFEQNASRIGTAGEQLALRLAELYAGLESVDATGRDLAADCERLDSFADVSTMKLAGWLASSATSLQNALVAEAMLRNDLFGDEWEDAAIRGARETADTTARNARRLANQIFSAELR